MRTRTINYGLVLLAGLVSRNAWGQAVPSQFPPWDAASCEKDPDGLARAQKMQKYLQRQQSNAQFAIPAVVEIRVGTIGAVDTCSEKWASYAIYNGAISSGVPPVCGLVLVLRTKEDVKRLAQWNSFLSSGNSNFSTASWDAAKNRMVAETVQYCARIP